MIHMYCTLSEDEPSSAKRQKVAIRGKAGGGPSSGKAKRTSSTMSGRLLCINDKDHCLASSPRVPAFFVCRKKTYCKRKTWDGWVLGESSPA